LGLPRDKWRTSFQSIKTKMKFGILLFMQILNTKFNWDCRHNVRLMQYTMQSV
jgi:hypothetical protein